MTRAVARYSNGNHQRSALLPIERQGARARKPRLQSYNPISASAHLAHFLSYVTHETQVATQAGMVGQGKLGRWLCLAETCLSLIHAFFKDFFLFFPSLESNDE